MKIKAELNLDDLWTGLEWDTAVGEIVRNELQDTIGREVRRGLRDDKNLKKLITKIRRQAIASALKTINIGAKQNEHSR